MRSLALTSSLPLNSEHEARPTAHIEFATGSFWHARLRIPSSFSLALTPADQRPTFPGTQQPVGASSG